MAALIGAARTELVEVRGRIKTLDDRLAKLPVDARAEQR